MPFQTEMSLSFKRINRLELGVNLVPGAFITKEREVVEE